MSDSDESELSDVDSDFYEENSDPDDNSDDTKLFKKAKFAMTKRKGSPVTRLTTTAVVNTIVNTVFLKAKRNNTSNIMYMHQHEILFAFFVHINSPDFFVTASSISWQHWHSRSLPQFIH